MINMRGNQEQQPINNHRVHSGIGGNNAPVRATSKMLAMMKDNERIQDRSKKKSHL